MIHVPAHLHVVRLVTPLNVLAPPLLRTTNHPLPNRQPKRYPFHQVQPHRVPMSARYASPLTHTTPANADWRPSGMVPKLDAVRPMREDWSTPPEAPYVVIGTVVEDACPTPTITVTSAPDAATRIMEP